MTTPGSQNRAHETEKIASSSATEWTRSRGSMNEGPRAQITAALRLLIDCARLYARTDDQGRRLANQAFTNGIEIGED